MLKSIFISAILGAASISASPVAKRQAASSGLTDADILNFALILEHFEATFYNQALARFSAADFTSAGYASNIRANIEQIRQDENDHVSFLTTALTGAGATPVSACNYTVDSMYDSVTGFLGLSQVIEGVGVSAYLGAAQYISNPAYLTAAGAILTAEARHNAFIRYINKYSPFVVVDTPLDPTAVTSIVAPFFANCPSGSAPPFTPFPAANLTSTTTLPGSTIQVSFANSSSVTNAYCIFFSGLQNSVAPYANGSCTIPTANATTGQAYGVISSSQTFNDSTVLAGPFVLQYDRANNTASGSGNSSSGMGSNAAASTGAAVKTQAAVAGLSLVMAALGSIFFL